MKATNESFHEQGHLHLDHAGGLENFRGTDIPIYCHEKEIKHAFFSVATKTDIGAYLPQHLGFDVNWKAWYGSFLEIAPGISLRHAPGHTPGLSIMQVNLQDSGTFIFTTELVHGSFSTYIGRQLMARTVNITSRKIMRTTNLRAGLRGTMTIGAQAIRW